MATGTIPGRRLIRPTTTISGFSALNDEWTAPASGIVTTVFTASSAGAGEITIRDTTYSATAARGYIAASKVLTLTYPVVGGVNYKINALTNSGSVVSFFFQMV